MARLYRGAPIEARRAERRAQLIAAAIRIYGEVGYRNATVRSVCEAARLTERYFYESFDNSEALLIAAYVHVTDALHQEMADAGAGFSGDCAERAAAVLRIYFSRLREQPQAARVFLLEIAGLSEAVDVVGITALKTMRGILLPSTNNPVGVRGADAPVLLSAGVMGAVINIALRWVSQGYVQPLDDVVSTAVAFCRVALAGAVPPEPTAKIRARGSFEPRGQG